MRRRRDTAVAISAVTALLVAASPTCAQLPRSPLPASAYGVPWQQLNDADRRFIREFMLAGYFAIDLGRLAARNGAASAIRRDGAQTIRRGNARLAALAALAGRKGVKTPRSLDPGHIARLDRLAALRDAAFDRAYQTVMAASRGDEIRACDAEAADGSDPDVRDFARRLQALLTSPRRIAGHAAGSKAKRR